MKRLAAALLVLAATAVRSAAQLPAPTPPPVPSFPLEVSPLPPQMPSLPIIETPEVIEGLVVPNLVIPDIRVPTQFNSRYSAPSEKPPYVNLRALNRMTDSKASSSCSQCGPLVCGPAGRIWIELEVLVWQPTGDRIRPLVTTSPGGTAVANAGVLGTPGVAILAGNSSLNDDFRAGSRFNIGGWFNAEQTFGAQIGSFGLADHTDTITLTSTGTPILARPFTNAVSGAEASQLIAFPAVVGGTIAISERNRINGFDVALRGNMCCTADWRLDTLMGYRRIRVEDDLAIDENVVAGAAAPTALAIPAGTAIHIGDRFNTTNTFNGVQVGIAGEYRFNDRWLISGTGRASLGWIDQVTDITGVTTSTVPGGAPITHSGGFLALSSNSGRHAESTAIIVPEVNLNVGYQLTRRIRLQAGYSFLYLASVVRPGIVAETTINPGLIPPAAGPATPARPDFPRDHTDFFLHGASGGVEIRF